MKWHSIPFAIVGDVKLIFEELYTLLAQIKVNLNSRPLTATLTDPENVHCITLAIS